MNEYLKDNLIGLAIFMGIVLIVSVTIFCLQSVEIKIHRHYIELNDGEIICCSIIDCYKEASCRISGCTDGIMRRTNEFKIMGECE